MTRLTLLAAATGLLVAAAPLQAHEVPGIEHTHAFEKTGYGTYRQGHAVNNQVGDIIIWSPRTYTGYQNPPSVKFARPEPITKAPSSPNMQPKPITNPALQYGKKTKDGYGKQ